MKAVEAVTERTRAASAASLEAPLLARYLLRSNEVPATALERFEAGCVAHFAGESSAQDLAVCRFVTRRPWSLPYLDATLGLLAPQALLRKKLFLMLAILEAMPQNAAMFTPRPASTFVVLMRLFLLGSLGCLKALVGAMIYPIARRAS